MGEITGIPPGKELGEEVLQTRLPSPADSVFGDGRGDEEADRIEENQRDLDLLPEGHKPQNENGNFPESTQQTQIITDSTKGPGGPRKKRIKRSHGANGHLADQNRCRQGQSAKDWGNTGPNAPHRQKGPTGKRGPSIPFVVRKKANANASPVKPI